MQVAGGLELIGGIAGTAALLPFLAEFAIPLILALFSAIIGLVAVFVTLQIRIMLIDFLIILSPIALLLWVLPNTDKYFKMWRETLIKLLLMYPIIILLLATSKLFSVIITGAGDISNWTKLSAALAPIIALFLIPATFKFASSALMMGHNFVSGHAKRGHGAIGGMQDKMKQNRQYNRQQKGLGTLNSLSEKDKSAPVTGLRSFGRGIQRRRAQQQAGLSIDQIDPNRIAGALEKNDKEQLEGMARTLGGDLTADLVTKGKSSDQYVRRAAIGELAKRRDTAGLNTLMSDPASPYGDPALGGSGKGVNDPEYIKAIGGNFSDIKALAPHLTTDSSKAFGNMSVANLAELNADGVAGMVAHRSTLTGTDLTDFDAKMSATFAGLAANPANLAKIKPDQKAALNSLGALATYTTLP